ncbi:MAG TPA: VCBS repeat-containing protein [Candidatus Kapabacteria bacterium]|nr:VCBS repeat-containing protein [Candidatus Kapabacteria bacterium]
MLKIYQEVRKLSKVFKLIDIKLLLILVIIVSDYSFAQLANPSNWMYPNGNLNATSYNKIPSSAQFIDSFSVKWSSPFISGDVKPLIGNIVATNPLLNFAYEPNEIAAVMGDEIVMISGTGSLLKRSKFPNYVNGIKSISALIDTNTTNVDIPSNSPLVLALEGIEQFNPLSTDSLAYSYIFGYNSTLDSIAPLKRLAINLRPFKPNIFANIKPIYGKRINNRLMLYATVNMSLPKILDPFAAEAPFYRGLAEFYDINSNGEFPLPDLKDDINNRVMLGPEVNQGQPSIFSNNGTNGSILLPIYPTTKEVNPNFEFYQVSSLVNGEYIDTYSDIPYLVGIDFDDINYKQSFTPYEINLDQSTRPLIKPYYLDIIDNATGEQGFILVTEQYSGMDASFGLSKLHLHDKAGNPLTDYDLTSDINPGFKGDTNHYWSISIGNLDGNSNNAWLPYYPNNNGKEIIATQSSRDFAYPGSILYVLRYYTGPEVEKPSPNGDFLFPLDTICSQRINGWVAAVNDLDNSGDGKDEILLADGSKLMIIRMRDYSDNRFRLGYPFDTLFVKEFFNQQISSVAVADLEGDGKNDIIVTTDDSTYVIGSVIPNTLVITQPSKNITSNFDYCASDTVELIWVNTIYSQDKVDLLFEYSNGVSLDTLVLDKDIQNNKDTVKYYLFADSLIAGKSGKFIVSGASKPYLLSDYSANVSFNLPKIDLNTLLFNKVIYRPNDNIIVSGDIVCADSITLQIKIDSLEWQVIAKDTLGTDNQLNINGILPCIDKYFNCDFPKSDTVIAIRFIAQKGYFSDTTSNINLVFKPIEFPIKIDTSDRADPTIYFNWDIDGLDSNLLDKDLMILVSADSGKTFEPILNTPISDEKTYWNVPVNVPDTLMFRMCVSGTCVRIDTMLFGIKPTYIDIVAPNPFNPEQESLQIVYQVPEDTRVTIRIVDQNNRIIGEVINSQDRKKGIVYSDYWDGKRNDGASSAIGMYYILLELSNGKKEVSPVYIRK